MGSFGVQELLIILLIVFVLFGAKKVPEIMKSFGQGIREFKRESQRIVADLEAPARVAAVETAALPESTEGQSPRPSG